MNLIPDQNPAQDFSCLSEVSVLYVEDEGIARLDFLHNVGVKLGACRLAASGQEGLFSFARFAPDIVITDIRMPDMSGLELARAIRSMGAHVPIIISTAHESVDFLRQAIACGVWHYLVKPVGPRDYLGCLVKCAAEVKQRREEEIQRKLHETVLLSQPSPALLVRRVDRAILLANQAAQALGYASGGRDPDGFAGAWKDADLEEMEFAATRRKIEPAVIFGHAAFGRVWNVSLSMVGPGLVYVGATDVTKAAELEQALRRAEQTYRNIFENAAEGIFQASPEGELLKANAAMARLLGYDTAEELFAKPRPVITGFLADPGDWTQLNGALKERGEITGFDSKIIRREGRLAWLSVSARLGQGAGGGETVIEGLAEDVTERKLREQELSKRATQDLLTGLPNRSYFQTQSEHMLAQAKRTKTPMALLYIDLDGFKLINDTFGHHAGDLVLTEMAKRLSGRLRKSDFLARIGGDEFFIILWNVQSRDKVRAIAQTIIEDAKKPILVEGVNCQVGASVGVSLYPDDGDSPENLIKKADAAMYMAKRLGKNICQVFSSDEGFLCST